jgi:hypothetical protein
MATCFDYANLKEYKKFDLPKQEIPESLGKGDNESLEEWRDRLYLSFRIPTILAALSDLKLSYVEQVCPLLFRNIIQTVLRMPDRLRTGRFLYKRIVTSLSPEIPFAKNDATASFTDILKNPEFAEFLRKQLESDNARKLFREDFLSYILENVTAYGSDKHKAGIQSLWKLIIKYILPKQMKNILRDRIAAFTKLDFNILALRVFIIIRMHQILNFGKLMSQGQLDLSKD